MPCLLLHNQTTFSHRWIEYPLLTWHHEIGFFIHSSKHPPPSSLLDCLIMWVVLPLLFIDSFIFFPFSYFIFSSFIWYLLLWCVSFAYCACGTSVVGLFWHIVQLFGFGWFVVYWCGIVDEILSFCFSLFPFVLFFVGSLPIIDHSQVSLFDLKVVFLKQSNENIFLIKKATKQTVKIYKFISYWVLKN